MAELIIALVALFGLVVGATMLVIADNGGAVDVEDGDDEVSPLDEQLTQLIRSDPTED